VAYIKIDKWELTTIHVYYWMPDYLHILNLFSFQDDDVPPEYPRMQRFVKYWEENLEARIKEIQIGSTDQSEIRLIDKYFHIN
jgi:uncharacterized protein Usg